MFGAINWADEIAEVTTDPEFQTATIRIFRVKIAGEWDMETNIRTGQVIETVYDGQARLVPVRWSTFQQAAASMNTRAEQSIRIQIPKDAVSRALTGWMVEVTAAPRNPGLVGRTLKVQADFQGSSSAARTFDCAYDNDEGGMP